MVEYIRWYDFLVKHGRINAFSENFASYSPASLYLISFVSLFSWIPKILAIKSISYLFELSGAFAVYQILRFETGNKLSASFGAVFFLLLPSNFLESGVWGQCDIVFTSFLIWMAYAVLKNKSWSAMLLFSIAISFKLQAIFTAPLLIILLFKQKIRWYQLIVIPVIYCASFIVPFIKGRPLSDLINIYQGQINTFPSLSMNAPNPYHLLSWYIHYDERIVIAGVGFACIIVLLLAGWRIIKKTITIPRDFLYDLAMFSFLIPFLLPKMHERYFFVTCVFIMLLSLLDRKMLIPAILIQASSTLSYLTYLANFRMDLTLIAFLINIPVLVCLLAAYFSYFKTKPLVDEHLPVS